MPQKVLDIEYRHVAFKAGHGSACDLMSRKHACRGSMSSALWNTFVSIEKET